MTYDAAVQYIHSLEKFGINPGLERIAAICAALGNPQEKLKFIHVAGTNGKGSTSAMLSEIMQQAGYKTGLFTSPYVIDFRERMQINGKMISQTDLAEIITELEPVISALAGQGIQATEFEAITASAFLYYERSNCDIVVLEVGLGGRFDATNIIKTPLASVITSISMDHMAVLGDTIEKIAFEKCGIIKQNVVTVCYPEQPAAALAVMKETAKQKKNTLIVPSVSDMKIIDESIYGSAAVIGGLAVFVPFMGEHMVKNALTAVHTARMLSKKGLNISEKNITDGIAAAKMPARMEIVGKAPLIILDGGHNEGCARAIASCIKRNLHDRRIIAVCGMMADKDFNAYMSIAGPCFETFIATKPSIPRALDAQTLALTAQKYCENSFAVENSLQALRKAKELADKEGVILICGSFYLASEIREKTLNQA